MTRTTRWACLALALMLSLAPLAAAQPSSSEHPPRWQTIPGGDAQGDHLHVTRPVHDGSLRGARTVERVTPAAGSTTGSETVIVLSGSEPESQRTVSVHLPYGARIDLAAGQAVEVELDTHPLGLGWVHEVWIARDGRAVVLATGSARSHGVGVRRGAESSRAFGDRRHLFGLELTIARHRYTLEPGELYQLDEHTLVAGAETTYDSPRPPDAFDERTLVLVRLAPMAPLPPGADS